MKKTNHNLALEQTLQSDSKILLESAIEINLQMSVEKRIEAHENARQLMMDLRQAGQELDAKSQRTS